ncbi:hypothetical protein F5882DRAFT_89056 [Hyaloscypha sp. PMI_1271]|nr:hypothetical protein F5882DRAFT_89056 [Hyaloscypha sp. PMI_1271]
MDCPKKKLFAATFRTLTLTTGLLWVRCLSQQHQQEYFHLSLVGMRQLLRRHNQLTLVPLLLLQKPLKTFSKCVCCSSVPETR